MLIGQVMVAELLDCKAFCRYGRRAWFSASMKVCCHAEVVIERRLRLLPDAEEANLAPDFLAPLAVVVRGQRKRGTWLDWLVSAPVCRLADEHGDAPYGDRNSRISHG
jgi:hypothetical protein